MAKKGPGWHKHSREHALAARGIKMKASANFRPHRPTGRIDYRSPRETFFAFWKASIENDWSEFDFDQAFKEAERVFREELAYHGAYGGEEFLDRLRELDRYWVFVDNEALFEELMASMPYVKGEHPEERLIEVLSEEDALSVMSAYTEDRLDDLSEEQMGRIADAVAEEMWEHFSGDNIFGNIEILYNKMKDPPIDLQEKILLYDQIIHTQHNNGSIWEYVDDEVDVEKLREEFNRIYRGLPR